jgi:hypothetical protein
MSTTNKVKDQLVIIGFYALLVGLLMSTPPLRLARVHRDGVYALLVGLLMSTLPRC